METEHIAVQCSVKRRDPLTPARKQCEREASHWVRDWNGHTFYMCEEHMEEIAGEDADTGDTRAEIYMPNALTGDIGYTEIGVYACSEECRACN